MFKAYADQKYGFDEPDTVYSSLLKYYLSPNQIFAALRFKLNTTLCLIVPNGDISTILV